MLPLVAVKGQSFDFGTEWEAKYSHNIVKGTSISVGEELRLKRYSTRLTKSETTLALSQALFRKTLKQHDVKLRLGVSYAFIYRYNKNDYYEPQHRLNVQMTSSKRWGDWSLSTRVRYQTTFRDTHRGSYKYNPQMYMRYKLSLAYTIPSKPWKLTLSEECFQRLNHPSHKVVDEFRTVIEAQYRIDRHNTIAIHLKASNEMLVKNPDHFFAIGAAYEFD